MMYVILIKQKAGIMKITKIPFAKIQYKSISFDDNIKKSLMRIGFSFPIQVEHTIDGYLCIDGNKRLSAIADIMKDHPECEKFYLIPAIEIHNARTDNGWSRKRHH